MNEGYELDPNKVNEIKELKESSSVIREPIVSIDYLESLVKDNELLKEIFEDMLSQCLRYTQTVADMNKALIDKSGVVDGELESIDKNRTLIHNATIDSINIFSRALGKFEKDNSWVIEMAGNRAAYGRFAVLTTLSRLT